MGWGSKDKAICPHVLPWPVEGVPSVGVSLIYPNPYLGKFRRKPGKTPNV